MGKCDGMQVYLLEVGEYSYAHIVGVFSDKSRAEAAAVLIGGQVLEPYVVDEMQLEQPPDGMQMWSGEMTRDGKVLEVTNPCMLAEDGKRHEEVYALTTGDGRIYPKHYWRLRVYMYAPSEQSFVKSMNELRAQIIAGAKPVSGNGTSNKLR